MARPNPYSNKTVKRTGADGLEYEVPAPGTFNSMLSQLAYNRAAQDDEAPTKGALSVYAPDAKWRDAARGTSTTPSWVDGTATEGQATVNRRAPIVPIPSAILVQENAESADTKRPLGAGDSTRSVVDRTTGRIRTEEEEENRLRGAVLLR